MNKRPKLLLTLALVMVTTIIGTLVFHGHEAEGRWKGRAFATSFNGVHADLIVKGGKFSLQFESPPFELGTIRHLEGRKFGLYDDKGKKLMMSKIYGPIMIVENPEGAFHSVAVRSGR